MTTAADTIELLPTLPSLNIQETKAFYADKLGFSNVIYEQDDFLILRRDTLEIHFWLTTEKHLCNNSSVYFRGGPIADLHEEYRKLGLPEDSKSEPRFTPLAKRPWDMEEFYIHDPHGNLLKFGRIPL
ncbi:hypothetical protein SAMN04488518_108182 [Pseudovibrio ascidiaceicola]|uniref:Bleomycin resistance protein n=1 Tax=Pseudovibrio ascidiaceicola TaxID=285279 RepID=A0A1I4BVS7_9HYPH|nr:VOC family protein [Pseudovibrio ascidiaceicola]SFK72633.1 hypothetical protein SAMN04488518_108182 [Pseudovibrio ascidiaceicola]